MNEGMAKSMLGTTKDIFDSIIDPIDESMKALDATNFSDLGGKIFDTGEINAEGKKLIGNLEKARLLIREQNQSLRDQYDLYVQQNNIKNKQANYTQLGILVILQKNLTYASFIIVIFQSLHLE